jgi:hypothetical protein
MHLCDIIVGHCGPPKGRGHQSRNSYRCVQMETVGEGGKQMWQGVKWLCALVAVSCHSAPDIAAIQTAYEREASAGSRLCKR